MPSRSAASAGISSDHDGLAFLGKRDGRTHLSTFGSGGRPGRLWRRHIPLLFDRERDRSQKLGRRRPRRPERRHDRQVLCHRRRSSRRGGPAGGLVGDGYSGSVINSYATGFTGGNVGADAGGLVGYSDTMAVVNSYASGAVAAGSNSMVGGLIGDAKNPNLLTDTYWDITTSGRVMASQRHRLSGRHGSHHGAVPGGAALRLRSVDLGRGSGYQ